MNLNLFIAKKIKGNKREKGKLSSLSNRIACISVSISVIVSLIAIFISDGFKNEIKELSVGFSGEVLLIAPGMGINNDTYPIACNPSYLEKIKNLKGVKRVDGAAYKGGMVKSDESVQGVFFKGVDSTYSLKFYEKFLVEGRLPDFSGDKASSDIIISKRLASLMHYECGDKITAFFVEGGVRVRRFTLVGLFNAQLEGVDDSFALIDMRHTQKLNQWGENDVSVIEISLLPDADPKKISSQIENIILEDPAEDDSVVVSEIRYIYPHIFDWLELLDLNVLIILILMFVVAGFNMISSLLIILFEKTSMIGLLKALGMKSRNICQIFIYRGAYIVLEGMIYGNLIALLLAFLQNRFHIFHLNPENYFVDHIPIYLNFEKVIILNVVSFLLMVVIMVIPSLFIAKVTPDKTIKMS